MFLAPKDWTPAAKRAAHALEALLAEAEEDTVTRLYAHVVAERREQDWAAAHRVKRSKGVPCIARLIGRRCGPFGVHLGQTWRPGQNDEHPTCNPPGTDHAKLWLRDGKPVMFTSEPYGLDDDTLRQMVAFAERWGLEFSIASYPAGHFPGRVLWVVWRRRGDGAQG